MLRVFSQNWPLCGGGGGKISINDYSSDIIYFSDTARNVTATDLRDFPIHSDDDEDDLQDSDKKVGAKFEFGNEKLKNNSTEKNAQRKIQQCR